MKRRIRFAFDFAWPRLAYGTIVSPGRHNSKTPGVARFPAGKRGASPGIAAKLEPCNLAKSAPRHDRNKAFGSFTALASRPCRRPRPDRRKSPGHAVSRRPVTAL
jgi:hypothetical protein